MDELMSCISVLLALNIKYGVSQAFSNSSIKLVKDQMSDWMDRWQNA